ncbi:MAG: hypothetical protein HY319_10995 [Armatimonadetes bacterium]|nr:hypothetical protein [Armatimonadota bacterium]
MTEVFYGDLSAWSEAREIRAEASSQSNRPELNQDTPWPGIPPFSRAFVYRVYRDSTGELVWSRQQGPEEPSPCSLHVSDLGELVAEVDGGFLVHSAQGSLLSRLELMADFLDGAPDSPHIFWSTAGYLWPLGRLSYFWRSGERGLWVLVTGTGLRCGIDLVSGTPLKDEGLPLEQLVPREHQRIVGLLQDGAQALEQLENREESEFREQVRTAVVLAGRRRLKAAVPWLRALERVSWVDSFTGCGALNEEQGIHGPWTVCSLGFRLQVQLALRLLGLEPAGYAAYHFGSREGSVQAPEGLRDRELRARLLEPGMRAAEVLSRLGSPDYIFSDWVDERNNRIIWWDYDLRDERAESYTLRLEFAFRERGLARLETIRPPAWLHQGAIARLG